MYSNNTEIQNATEISVQFIFPDLQTGGLWVDIQMYWQPKELGQSLIYSL